MRGVNTTEWWTKVGDSYPSFAMEHVGLVLEGNCGRMPCKRFEKLLLVLIKELHASILDEGLIFVRDGAMVAQILG